MIDCRTFSSKSDRQMSQTKASCALLFVIFCATQRRQQKILGGRIHRNLAFKDLKCFFSVHKKNPFQIQDQSILVRDKKRNRKTTTTTTNQCLGPLSYVSLPSKMHSNSTFCEKEIINFGLAFKIQIQALMFSPFEMYDAKIFTISYWQNTVCFIESIIQKLAKIRIYLTPSVCNDLVFDDWQVMYNKLFLKIL